MKTREPFKQTKLIKPLPGRPRDVREMILKCAIEEDYLHPAEEPEHPIATLEAINRDHFARHPKEPLTLKRLLRWPKRHVISFFKP